MLVEFEITIYADPDGLSSISSQIESLLSDSLEKGSWMLYVTTLELDSEDYAESEYLVRQFSIENKNVDHGERTLKVIHIGIVDTIDVNEFGGELIKSFSPESFTEPAGVTVADRFPWELSSDIIEDPAGRERFFANYPSLS